MQCNLALLPLTLFATVTRLGRAPPPPCQARLHHNYYRQPAAVASDLQTIAANAATYNGASNELAADASALAHYLLAVLQGEQPDLKAFATPPMLPEEAERAARAARRERQHEAVAAAAYAAEQAGPQQGGGPAVGGLHVRISVPARVQDAAPRSPLRHLQPDGAGPSSMGTARHVQLNGHADPGTGTDAGQQGQEQDVRGGRHRQAKRTHYDAHDLELDSDYEEEEEEEEEEELMSEEDDVQPRRRQQRRRPTARRQGRRQSLRARNSRVRPDGKRRRRDTSSSEEDTDPLEGLHDEGSGGGGQPQRRSSRITIRLRQRD